MTYDYVPTPANVVKVTRFGIHHQPTVIQVAFSGTVDPTAAATPSNYTIILPNANGKFTGPGTLTLPVVSATFDATTKTATLVSSKRFNFRGQPRS